MQAQRPGEILVVDGDCDFLSFAATTLNRRGHAVRICAYASEAPEHLENYPFDAVIIAAKLPDSSGADLCAWIKSNEDLQGVPVAVTGEVNSHGIPLHIEPGKSLFDGPLAPDEFIVLPITSDEFALRVAGLLKLRRYREEIGSTITTLLAVAEGIEEQDRRARGHCKRLAIMAVLLGAAVGCDDYELLTLERAGYLHDIGKVCIPGAILEKSQPLTPREMEIIKEHTVLGERLCRPVMALQSVLPIIRHHHERGDGTGYPDGLRAVDIPRLAQIFSIVDVYDSLRTWRPYRASLNEWQAVDVMSHEVARGLWNRELFEAFARQVTPVLEQQFSSSGVMWPAE